VRRCDRGDDREAEAVAVVAEAVVGAPERLEQLVHAVVISAVAGLLPAIRAARLSPTEALRTA
jgi:hypothetical protein